mmetsp:Transcript_1406/g.3147  ORF Transcript_1406/g.3147 Transcript_1406/m.3147 type:complete len:924 (+) Transcript_1406:167-2938(+)
MWGISSSATSASAAASATSIMLRSFIVASCLSTCFAFAPPASTSSCLPPSNVRFHSNWRETCPRPSNICRRLLEHDHDESNYRSQNSRRDISLRMGIRSFLKKRILRRGDEGNSNEDCADGDGEKKSSSKQNNIDLRTVLQSPQSAGLMESPLSNYDSDDDDDKSGDTLEDDDGTEIAGKSEENSPTNPIRTDKNDKRTSKRKKKSLEDDNVLTSDMKQRLQEDAKERIRRVQTGGLTEEEKMAFLNTALTRTLPPKKPRGPPIRQKIPGLPEGEEEEDGAKSSGYSTGGKNKSGSSSTASTENIWNAIRNRDFQNKGKGGSGSQSKIPVSSLIVDGKLKSEEAKRQWIDTVTNPDRFSSFSSLQKSSITPEIATVKNVFDDENDDEQDEMEEDTVGDTSAELGGVEKEIIDESPLPQSQPDFVEMKRRIAEDQQLLKAPKDDQQGVKAVRDALDSIMSMTKMASNKKGENTTDALTNTAKGNQTDDLASRLEQAAVEQEKRVTEARLAAEKKAQDEKKAIVELQRQREAEFMRKENERMETARKQAEKLRRQEEEKKEAERARLEALQAQQDEYWAKKLEKERSKREANMSPEERRVKEQKAIVNATESSERVERDVAKEVKRQRIREEERLREDKHEGEILKEAAEEKLHDRERTRDIMIESAARVSRTVPKPSTEDVSVSSFVQEQRRKKEELDRLAQSQAQQLKALNSPLPSHSKRPTGVAPNRPSIPVSRTPAPSSVPKRTPAPNDLSLASLTMKKSSGNDSSQVEPAPAKSTQNSSDRLSLAELTKLKTKDTTELRQSSTASQSSDRLNLFEMTKLKKEPNPSANTRKSVKSGPVPTTGKRPVRQQLPITSVENDDDEDDDDFMRSGAASGMTIADYRKTQKSNGENSSSSSGNSGKKNLSANDRAKQWGIDMSKFK